MVTNKSLSCDTTHKDCIWEEVNAVCIVLFLNIRYSSDLQKLNPKGPRFGICTQRSCHLYYSHGGGCRWLFNNGTFAWSSHNRGTFIAMQGCRMSTPLPSILSLEDKFPDKLRLSIVRPMLKEGNERYCNKYRPICLVSSNVLEYYIDKALWMSCVTLRRYVKFGLEQVYYIYHRKIFVKVMNSKQNITDI